LEQALNRVTGSPAQAFAFCTDFVSEESLDIVARAFEPAVRSQQAGFPLVLAGESKLAHELARRIVASTGASIGLVALAGVHSHELDILGIDGGKYPSELTVTIQSLVFR
jgi:hypothetical protein